MIELKKKNLRGILLTIAAFNKDNEMVSGLLTEELTLGTKRRLQKIHTACGKEYTEMMKEAEEINKLEDKEAREKEITDLLDETFSIDVDKVSIDMLDKISSKAVYDADVIDLISQ